MAVIEIKNLSKKFGKLEVLKNVNLKINEGEIIGIIGKSGCGKSVLLRSMELLEKPDEGQVFVLGNELTKKNANLDLIRRKMGMVFQNFYLFSHLDVMDNLCLAPCKLLKMKRKDAEEKAQDLLNQVGLLSKAHAMPEVLSGGQKQRIAIARCLMMEPKVLLFDEPTSALDPTMVGEVLATIRMLSKRGYTMVIVTHELNFAKEICSRILYLDDKGIYEEGTPKEIFEHPKKAKTIEFINKIKTIEEKINTKSFDLMGLQGKITYFCEKYGIDKKITYRLQLVAEDVIYKYINKYENEKNINITLTLRYIEMQKELELMIAAKGKEMNILSRDKNTNNLDDIFLGSVIIKTKSKDYIAGYENGVNILKVKFDA